MAVPSKGYSASKKSSGNKKNPNTDYARVHVVKDGEDLKITVSIYNVLNGKVEREYYVAEKEIFLILKKWMKKLCANYKPKKGGSSGSGSSGGSGGH